MFDFGQPQAPLPSDGMTYGEKMRREIAYHKKQKHEEDLAKVISDNSQCVGEFTDILDVLHDLNPSEVKFRLVPDTVSGKATAMSITRDGREVVYLDEFIYEQGRHKYCLISNELYQFLRCHTKELQEYFDLGDIKDESTIPIEKGTHKGWQLFANSIRVII